MSWFCARYGGFAAFLARSNCLKDAKLRRLQPRVSEDALLCDNLEKKSDNDFAISLKFPSSSVSLTRRSRVDVALAKICLV